MAMYDDKFIEELKAKNNIVDTVGRYCNLQRKGSNYWACCPLPGHTEKTPSFAVNEPGQFYHCFGCGKSGDVIKFIEEVETVDFQDAVKILAEHAKMTLPVSSNEDEEEVKKARERKERLYGVLKDTAKFYVSNLRDPRAQKWLEYLGGRGIDGKTVNTFGLGASLDYDSLPIHLKKLGYTEQEMLDAGVCKRNEHGKIYDFEAERLIVPIINALGRVVAFGGRIYEDKGFGKYKNTSDTVIFNKKNTLFAINNLKKVKQEENFDKVIMVEGYMDAISLYMAGFRNVVASMGTSLTLSQAKMLKRYCSTVIVSYDGDSAGQNATIRSLEIFENEGFEIKVVSLPDGLDPDDVIRKYGREAYATLLLEAKPLIDFRLSVIENGKDLTDVADKRKYVQECLALIRTLKDEFIKEELLQKVSTTAKISYASLKRDLDNGSVTVPTVVEEKPQPQFSVNIPKSDGISVAERTVLWALLNDKPYAHGVDVGALTFTSGVRERVAEELLYDEPSHIKPNLYKTFKEDELGELQLILSAGDTLNQNQEQKYFEDCLRLVKKQSLQGDVKRLNELYATELNPETKKQIAQMVTKKVQELRKL